MSILEFLGLGGAGDGPAGPETETVRLIVQRLDRLDPERARFIAAFAYVLSRVAHADLEISAEETRAMETIVRERGGLPEADAAVVVQMAQARSRLFGGTENFLVTREFGRIATREQKLALLDCLFVLSSADARIEASENHAIRRIADELRLEHGDFIAVRSRFREHLSVLKKRDPGA
jgi:uncharacterized tellurite resistance protein B-like protein